MGTSYLLDTNIAIYFLNGLLPDEVRDFVKEALNENGSLMSVITKIELLSWPAATSKQNQEMEDFLKDSEILPLSDSVIAKTVEIRRTTKIKLPDAIIAATAIIHGFTLLSRNDDDFRKILGLKYLNPFSDI